MKITKLINVETEVEVHVTAEDIAHAIMEPDTNRLHAVMCGINNVGAYLKAIPDSVLAEMNDAQKQTVAKFLNDQARRFMPNILAEPPPVSGGEAQGKHPNEN